MKLNALLTIVASLGIASSASAINRMGFEVVPLQENPLPSCNQTAAIAVNPMNRLDVVNESPDNYQMFVLFKPKAINPLSVACRDNPILCLTQFAALPIQARELLTFVAGGLPDLEVAVAGAVGNDIVYSKVSDIEFVPCPYTTIPRVVPGNGLGTSGVSLADRGPVGHPLRDKKPVTKWGAQDQAVVGGTHAHSKHVVSLVTYTKNIDQVIFSVSSSNGQTGHVVVPGSNVTYDPETGAKGYTAELNDADWTGASTLTVSATVIPVIGRPVVMTGAPTTQTHRELDEYAQTVFDNSNNGLRARKVFYVATNGVNSVASNCTDPNSAVVGSAPLCCGGVNNPCQDMDGAMRSMQRVFNPAGTGTTDISGAILQFKEGTYKFGTLQPYWPGFAATMPFTVKGSKSALYSKVTTRLNGRTDHESYGYPSSALLFAGNMNYESLNLQNDLSGPNARSYIIPSTSNPGSFVNIKDVHFRGAGITACLGDTDGTSSGLARVVASTFVDGNFNGGAWKNFLVWISSYSIAFSEVPMIVNSGATVHQKGQTDTDSGFFPGCVYANTPHGDLARIASRPEILISGFNTTKINENLGQGLFLSNIPAWANQMQALVENSYFRVGNGNEGTPGRVALLGNILFAIFHNVIFGTNAPTTHGCFDAATCSSPGFYAIESNRLFGPDAQMYSTPEANFTSSVSNIRYRADGDSNSLF